MRYLILWAAIAAGLLLALIVLTVGGQIFINLASAYPWIPVAVVAVLLVATIAVAVDWLSDHPRPPRPDNERLPGGPTS